MPRMAPESLTVALIRLSWLLDLFDAPERAPTAASEMDKFARSMAEIRDTKSHDKYAGLLANWANAVYRIIERGEFLEARKLVKCMHEDVTRILDALHPPVKEVRS